ncbi:signal peptidase I [Vagococcus acidifermentans]
MMSKFKITISDVLWVVGLIIVVWLLKQYVFLSVIVSGSSMDPTMADGERVIALKMTEVERFDIVTFPAPDAPDKSYIKRVIGLPGDTVEYRDDTLYINGKAYEEPYLEEFKSRLPEGQLLTYNFTLEEVTGLDTVPEDSVFVMGDNRQNSRDSRSFGFIKKADISGDVWFSFWPLDKIGAVD